MTRVLEVAHCPTHAGATPAEYRRALALGAHSTGVTEAYRTVPHLQHLATHHCVVGDPKGRTPVDDRGRRAAWDNPILVRDQVDITSRYTRRVADASTPLKIAPARWLTEVGYELDLGHVRHMHLHPHAAVRGTDPQRVDRTAKYVGQQRRVETRAARILASDQLLTITGDLQVGRGGPQWAPEAMFERLGMSFWCLGVDWIAWDRRLRLDDRQMVPTTRNGQDHPWLHVALTRRPVTKGTRR